MNYKITFTVILSLFIIPIFIFMLSNNNISFQIGPRSIQFTDDINEVNINEEDIIPFYVPRNEETYTTELILRDASEVLSIRSQDSPFFFFIESSMSGEIKARQLCSVESTARLHRDVDVFLLVALPPNVTSLVTNETIHHVLRHHANIKILAIDMERYFSDSPLEKWYQSGVVSSSRFKVHHLSDVLRMFTLWKYGGTYLDLDIIVINKIDTINFVVRSADPKLICNGIMSFTPRHPFTESCVNEIQKHYSPKGFITNGPYLVTKMMNKMCGVPVKNMTKELCKGITLLPAKSFFPIPYGGWRIYFNERKAEPPIKIFKECLGAHVWNKFSVDTQVKVGSFQLYGILAQKFCPRAYWSCYDFF